MTAQAPSRRHVPQQGGGQEIQSIWMKIWQMLESIAGLPPILPEKKAISCVAAPGLVGLLDLALWRANEGGLSAMVLAASALLESLLEFQFESQLLWKLILLSRSSGRGNDLHNNELAEHFCRSCLECASEVIEKLTTDKLSHSANLRPEDLLDQAASTPVSSGSSSNETMGHTSSSGSNSNNDGVTSNHNSSEDDLLEWGVLEAARLLETGRSHNKVSPKRTDSWETCRLICPDYAWADEAHMACQRLLKSLSKHRFLTIHRRSSISHDTTSSSSSSLAVSDSKLDEAVFKAHHTVWELLKLELPTRLHQFRAATEANTVVSKRLYLIKCEYRACARSFFESHTALQTAPRLDMVQTYLKLHSSTANKQQAEVLKVKQKAAQTAVDEALTQNEILKKALTLERDCHSLEVDMAHSLLPFCELARYLESKKARITLPSPDNILAPHDIYALDELLRRLKSLLCRKSGPDSSTGIRPLLLDLQGVPRDDVDLNPFGTFSKTSAEEARTFRVQRFLSLLQSLLDLSKVRGGFSFPDKKEHYSIQELPANLVRNCNAALDKEMFEAQCHDWYAMSDLQMQDVEGLEEFPEQLRKLEMEVSIGKAPYSALDMVQKKLGILESDRIEKFHFLQDMVQQISAREMDLRIQLELPDPDEVLKLPDTTILQGVFGPQLLCRASSVAEQKRILPPG